MVRIYECIYQKYDDVGGCPGTDTVEAGSGGVTVVFGLLFKEAVILYNEINKLKKAVV